MGRRSFGCPLRIDGKGNGAPTLCSNAAVDVVAAVVNVVVVAVAVLDVEATLVDMFLAVTIIFRGKGYSNALS